MGSDRLPRAQEEIKMAWGPPWHFGIWFCLQGCTPTKRSRFCVSQSGSSLVSAQRAKAASGRCGCVSGATAPGHGPGARNPPTVEGRSLAVRPSRQQATSVQQGRCGQLTPAWPGSGSVGHLSDLSGGSAGFLKCRGLSPSPRPLFPQNNTIFFKAQFPIDK